ncbi:MULTISPECIES: hypothetical protein [Vibrio]|uniref:Uncharacterized protein n=2 Tax=Vibrio TaxID=662 RepID=A0A510IF30_9VIBR|nr:MULTISPECIES: hypothetical protein [Vibrio]RTZ23008.1 hypothetical protein EKN09_11030 [Vibrio penaeicida]BBL92323.1 hypothetical protein VroAM7_49760 [Vibrio rotiferianus]GLQ71062.1 hypothetical protein GCM10007932_04220 [Vibrio penaeicida]
MDTNYLQRWFWIYLAILVVAYGMWNTNSSLADFYLVKSEIDTENNFHQFFDIEVLTSPAWVGFLNSLLSGFFLDPSYMSFEVHDPLLKVNYSQGMAEILIGHALVPYLIGSLIGTGMTLFICGGFLALVFHSYSKKVEEHG